jgi:hypothetical protein
MSSATRELRQKAEHDTHCDMTAEMVIFSSCIYEAFRFSMYRTWILDPSLCHSQRESDSAITILGASDMPELRIVLIFPYELTNRKFTVTC